MDAREERRKMRRAEDPEYLERQRALNRERVKRWRDRHPETSRERVREGSKKRALRLKHVGGDARLRLRNCKRRAEKKGWDFDLDVEWIQERLDAGICEMSGIQFLYGFRRTWDSFSIDRIDSTKGYTKDNCRAILWCLNLAFSTWGEEVLKSVVLAWVKNMPAEKITLAEKFRLGKIRNGLAK